MLYFVIALPAEARPLIKHYNLKRIDATAFTLYYHDQTALIVSGIGRDNALMATTYLLSLYPPAPNDLLVNMGICAADPSFKIGQTILIHAIESDETQKSIFPDLRFTHPFKEASLTTFTQPQNAPHRKAQTADMEGYFVAKAALNFLTTSQLLIAKVVSDHFQSHLPSKEDVTAWMQMLLDDLQPLIAAYQAQISTKISYSQSLQTALEQLQNNLQLTQSQTHQLSSLLNYYILRHRQEPLLPKYIASQHKKEQKDAFNKLLILLSA